MQIWGIPIWHFQLTDPFVNCSYEGWGLENYCEDPLYLLLLVGRIVLQLLTLQTPRFSFLASALGLLAIQTWRYL